MQTAPLAGRAAAAAPPSRPPFLAGPLLTFLPRPLPPGFLPPPVDLFTVAHALRILVPGRLFKNFTTFEEVSAFCVSESRAFRISIDTNAPGHNHVKENP